MARPPRISCREFGRLPDGSVVHEYTLSAGELTLSAIELGGIVTRLMVPDRAGRCANVVLGFDNLADYVERNPHFGAIVGRYGNRIAEARFTLDGEVHALSRNDGPNCLHGGLHGFGARLWRGDASEPAGADGVALTLRCTSPHGEEGFPGRMDVCVRYRLGSDASWRVDYEATCDRPTVVNLTHHDYFNLAGRGSATAQHLMIPARHFHAVDSALIPISLADVANTPFDFRQPTVIEARLRQGHEQLLHGRGYDHHWLLDSSVDNGGLRHAARLEDPGSGRTMDIHTTEPGVQFYSGNFLDGTLLGSGGEFIRQGDGVCLETQHSPNSPNRPEWPSTTLRPGAIYRSATVHRFGVSR